MPQNDDHTTANGHILISTNDIIKVFSLMCRDHTYFSFKKHRVAALEQGKCPICDRTLEENERVFAVHKAGYSRKEIIQRVVARHLRSDVQPPVVDMQAVLSEYDDVHRREPIVAVGCDACHRAYDKGEKEIGDDLFRILE